MTKVASLKQVIGLYAFILVVWGFYRWLFRLPPTVEELVLKPVVWLVPLVWILRKEKLAGPLEALNSVGWTTNNLFRAVYLAVGLGMLFAVEGAFVNSVKYGGSFHFFTVGSGITFLLAGLGLSLVTAISEETVFRGFLFNRLWKMMGEWRANIVTSVGWTLVHLPVTVFALQYGPSQVFYFLLLTFLFGAASSFVFARTNNVLACVLLHVFWEWPIILFR